MQTMISDCSTLKDINANLTQSYVLTKNIVKNNFYIYHYIKSILKIPQFSFFFNPPQNYISYSLNHSILLFS